MRVLIALLLFAISFCSVAQPQKTITNIAEVEKKGGISAVLGNDLTYTLASSDFTTYYARCRWNIDPAVYYISGSVTYYINLTRQSNSIVFDLDNALVVDSVMMHNSRIGFTQNTNKTLTVSFAQTLLAGQKDSLAIYYRGAPASSGFGSFIKRTHGGGVPVIWTLSEPYGARDWWPCRNGLDDKIDSIDIFITHPTQYAASANGLPVNKTATGSSTTSYFKHRYPVATYLVGIAVTNYTSFTQQVQLQKGILPVITTVYPEYLSYFQTYVPTVYNALQLYDQYFGAYPFMNERYGQTEFDWGGGMEHQSNSFITNAEEHLTAHELGHQWFGDKVTLGSWQDIWLNEGFATYLADFFYTEHFHPESLAGVVSQSIINATAEPNGSVWVEDTTDVNRIFSYNLSYEKGAMLVRMLRWTLGDSIFFKGINQYLEDAALKYEFARTADLQRNLENASGQSLSYFFTQWFYGKGYPAFFVQWNWRKNKLQLQITETTSDASVKCFKVPLQLRFVNGSQQKEVVVNIQKNITQLTLPLTFKPDTVMIDPLQYLVSKNNSSAINSKLVLFDEDDRNPPLHLYPNPASNILHIQANVDDSSVYKTVTVVNSLGKIVYSKDISMDSQNPILVPVAALARGVYFVLIQNSEGMIIKRKFIKQ